MGAREGDVVKAGTALVQLDDRGVRAQLQEAQSALATATARADAARVGLTVMRKEVPVSIANAEANVAAAQAAEHRAITAEAQSKRDTSQLPVANQLPIRGSPPPPAPRAGRRQA